MGSAARKLRRSSDKQRQLKERTGQLSEAISALKNMEGLQELLARMGGIAEYIQKAESQVEEIRQLIDALVEDNQTLADERETERRVFCKVIAFVSQQPSSVSSESVETFFNEMLKAELGDT
jgi:regulator of replication initiation timing